MNQLETIADQVLIALQKSDLSVKQLAKQLDRSPHAISKAVNRLRKRGYTIYTAGCNLNWYYTLIVDK